MDLSQALVQVRVRSPGRHRQRLQPAGAERRGSGQTTLALTRPHVFPRVFTWPMCTGDWAVQRPPPRRPDPDRDLQREARDRLRGEWYLVAHLLSLFDAFHELSPQCCLRPATKPLSLAISNESIILRISLRPTLLRSNVSRPDYFLLQVGTLL